MAQEILEKRLEATSQCAEAASSRFIREVVVNGQKIVFHLERKPVKNLNLRIRRDGSVHVSASRRVPIAEIDKFVQGKAKFVLSAIERFRRTVMAKPQPKQYVSGETFCILGRNMRLMVSRAEKDFITSDEAYIYLAVREPEDFDLKRRIIERFRDQRCMAVFGEIMDALFPLVGKYGVSRPALKIRAMETRWGSCLVYKGIVTLSKRLVEAPMCCIEYVILHELCHFIHPNHSVKFYALLSALMPDWKERKKLLNFTMT